MTVAYKGGQISVDNFFEIKFFENNIENVFACKVNRTLSEMLQKKKYSNISCPKKDLKDYGGWGIGRYLKMLKDVGDDKYKLFLNKNGDDKYCYFKVSQASKIEKGLYFIKVNDSLKYIGRCLTNFDDRINKNYGKITPTNCYKDGQSTNCHINSKINLYTDSNISISFHRMRNTIDIKLLEKNILDYNPDIFEWNIQRS